MEHATTATGALTVALALVAGILGQALARHLRIPGIVILLGFGVLLGPDVLGVVHPGTLGSGLSTLVGFAVAVILFEGGMGLSLERLRSEGRSIRQLVTVGALVTAVGGTLAARLILGWSWSLSVLFGTLVIVTGPTVVGPLLKRLKVKASVSTVLEAEGVLIDAVGAIIAVMALEVMLSPSGETFALGMLHVVGRLGFGALLGALGGLLIAGVLRLRNLVPEGLENVFTLSLVLLLFQGSNAVLAESGLAAVTVGGLVVGNLRGHAHRELLEFKEQLTVLLIGMLFVLLAADVRLAQVRDLGWAGLLTVAALVLVVRPLTVLASTRGSGLGWREKAFVSWIGPRGIVAAAVASLFAEELNRYGLPGGDALRAMVFLVIAVTVLLAGLTGGPVARLLRLRRPQDVGWAILGANELGCAVARVLKEEGEEVVLIDANPQATLEARNEGLPVIYGNALDERTLGRAELDTRAGAVALTPNEEVNLLFASKAKREARLGRLLVALKTGTGGVTAEMVDAAGAQVLFGAPQDVPLWATRLRRHMARVERWRQVREPDPSGADDLRVLQAQGLATPLAFTRGGRTAPVGGPARFRKGDRVAFLIHTEAARPVHEWLLGHGWVPAEAASSEESGAEAERTAPAASRTAP